MGVVIQPRSQILSPPVIKPGISHVQDECFNHCAMAAAGDLQLIAQIEFNNYLIWNKKRFSILENVKHAFLLI